MQASLPAVFLLSGLSTLLFFILLFNIFDSIEALLSPRLRGFVFHLYK